MKRRWLALLLAAVMLAGTLPAAALAASARWDEEVPMEAPAAHEDAAVSASALSGVWEDSLATPSMAVDAELFAADERAASGEYTIYPLPREINYEASTVEIPAEVNVVWGGAIDSYTKQHLTDALAELSFTVTTTERAAAQTGAFNILVGVRGDGSAADTALTSVNSTMTIQSAGQTYTEDIFTGAHAFDAYIIRVTDSGIAVVGKDTDAAYYAITTLKHIFEEMAADGTAAIRKFTLRDYASVAYRGFIEGYYGIPWSHENRISLMKWGGEWKMNMYVFAPKDDLYHNTLWRELYPAEELPKITKLAETGLETKNRYVYALHPFQTGPFNFNNFDSELKLITDKFDQLYGVGVRQFAIMADDAGTYSGENFARLLNALNVWRKGKEGVYPLIFCPDKYNASWCNSGDYVKMAKLNDLTDDDISIFWTGLGVCGHATVDDAKAFVDNINNATADDKACRNPLLWLNWPVDDVNMSRLVLGPGSNEGGGNGYSTKVPILAQGEADYFAGIISNPMQQAQLDKIPLFAVADFAWNDDGYNGQQSWADSFRYVDPDAADALHTIAKHISDPSPNGHSLICGESEELKEQLAAFQSAYTSGGSVADLADPLIAEFETIIAACDTLAAQSENKGLLEEIDSHRRSLRDISESAIAFIRTIVDLEEGRNADVWGHYSQGTAKLASSQTYPIPLLNGGVQMAQSGAKRIIPFVNTLADRLAEPVQRVLDPDYGGEEEGTDEFYAEENSRVYGNNPLTNAVDGDINTMAWFWGGHEAGQRVGIRYAKPVTIYNFRVLCGDAGANPGGDHFYDAVLEYRVKGSETFAAVPNGAITEANTTWDLTANPLVDVVEIRVRVLTGRNDWVKLREFGIYEPEDEPVAAGRVKYPVTGFKHEALTGDYGQVLGNMVDGNETSYANFYHGAGADYILADEYMGVDLGGTLPVGHITILQGKNDTDGDKLTDAVLEYSTDGTNYTVLKENISDNVIDEDYSDHDPIINARYVRLRSTKQINKWIAIREFSVEAPYSPVFRSEDIIYGYNDAAYGPDAKVVDGNDATYAHYAKGPDGNGNIPAGAFIGVVLEKKIALGRIRILQGNSDTHGDKLKDAILEYSADGGNTYHAILENINQNVINIDLSSSGIKATHVRLRNGPAATNAWLAMRTFSVEEATATDTVDTNVPAYLRRMCAIGYDSASIGVMLDDITLKPGEYLGLKLPRIRELNSVTVTGGVPAGLTLKAGCNELELKTVDPAAVTDSSTLNARYIRLVNETEAPVTVSFGGLAVTSKEIQTPSVVSSTMGGAIGNASALFDGDLNTEFGWQMDQPTSGGGQTVIDIGQVLHINSLQFIVNDSMKDWIRHAEVEGSLTPDGPWAKLVTVGTSTAGDNILDDASGWTHTISYCYSGSKSGDAPINVDARYLRITLKEHVTSFGVWSRIREIGINDLLVGNEYKLPYMKTANDPTFDCPNEVYGHGPQNLIDGNVSTTYIPDATSGTLIYRLSEGLDKINQISILQSPNTLSNAAVSVRAANASEFVPVGNLAFSMNEFNLMGLVDTVAEIKIQWTGMAPELHEILTVRKEPVAPNKDALETALAAAAALEGTVEYANSAADLVAAYAAAKADAQAAKASATVMQSGVDQAVSKLSAAIDAVKNQPFPVTGVALDKTAATIYTNEDDPDHTVTLTAIITPSNADNKTVSWESWDTELATVNNGVVTAVGVDQGLSQTIITVTTEDGGLEASCVVSVRTKLGGSVNISGAAKFGETLTAALNQITPASARRNSLSYQWKRNGADITDATDGTYVLTKDDIGANITVSVTASTPYEGTLTSASVTPTKANGPAAPDLTAISVTDCTEAGNDGKIEGLTSTVTYQISSDGVAWEDVAQGSTSVTGLAPGNYQLRVKATDTHEAGAPSSAITVAAYNAPTLYTVAVSALTGGAITVDKGRAAAGAEITVTVTPDEGYELVEGSVKVTLADNSPVTLTNGRFTMPAANVNVTAQFKKKTCTLTHNITNVTCDLEEDNHTVTYGEEFTITLTAAEGFDLPDTVTVTNSSGAAFHDYTYQGNTLKFTNGITEDITITGAAKVKTYTVVYTLSHLTADGQPAKVNHGAALSVTLAADEGYELPDSVTVTVDGEALADSDFTYDTATGDVSIPGAKITGNVVITAAAPDPNAPVTTYTVTFNSQGGSTVAAQTIAKGGNAVRPADPTRSGYTFGGWYTDTVCTGAYDFNTAVTGNLTLYAKWTAASSKPSSGGSTATTVTTNDDGDKVTTVTDNRTGTVTETTEKPDGTVAVVETKKDGTVTETVEEPDGTKSVTETKPDGTVTEKVEEADGTKAVTETKPDGSKTATVEQPDGTKSETVVTAEGDATITVTDPDGEELVKTEIPATIPEPETKFEDISATPWAEEAINKVAGLELVKGVGGNKYDPVTPMTRGALATVLHRLSNGKTDYEVAFKDVKENTYYTEGVAWAAKVNVVKGVSEDIFAPDQIITREQLAVMLARYAKLIGMNTKADAKALDAFADGEKTGTWAVDGMAWCVEKGILKGKGQGGLDPTAQVSRAEVAVMLDRFIALIQK